MNIYARDIEEEIETFREYIFHIDQKDAELTFEPKL
jgi:hypothetical protein